MLLAVRCIEVQIKSSLEIKKKTDNIDECSHLVFENEKKNAEKLEIKRLNLFISIYQQPSKNIFGMLTTWS